MKSFASDNYSGIHPQILEAIHEANNEHVVSYGDDAITLQAQESFQTLFGKVQVLFTFNGTGANVISLKCCTLPFQAVLCAETAHINADECGAPTQSIGCSLISIPTTDGKLTPAHIAPFLNRLGVVHNTQPKVISISQSTELGTVYSLEELKTLCLFAHQHAMYVHVDGARISNAVAALGVSLKEATVDCGVDIMSFGGTKNGLMIGEAVLIFNENLKQYAAFYQKQSAQLFSKNRFVAAQFVGLLRNNLWYDMAKHANDMAHLLADEISKLPQVKITQQVDANAVFVIIPEHAIKPLQQKFRFYIWDDSSKE
ncbi:MAG: threonine aldolase, partial [Porphyromonadaceae bacterium CG2_30_38_12]